MKNPKGFREIQSNVVLFPSRIEARRPLDDDGDEIRGCAGMAVAMLITMAASGAILIWWQAC